MLTAFCCDKGTAGVLRRLLFPIFKFSGLIRTDDPVHDVFIILRVMRKRACGTVLDRSAVMFEIIRFARTIRLQIKGAVAEQAVQVLYSLVAGIKLTFFIAEKPIRMFHNNPFSTAVCILPLYWYSFTVLPAVP